MYSFEPTDEQKMIVDEAKKLAEREFRSRMRDCDEKEEPALQWMKEGWKLSLLPASIPEEYGGFGEHSAITWALAAEELAFGDLSATLVLTAPNLVAFPVLLCGNEEQKQEILPAFCTDDYRPASAALQEPRFNFDPNRLETKAVKNGGDYVVSGTKCNVPLAEEAEHLLVYADLDGKTQGFLVSKNTPGLVVKEREKNMGMKAFPLYSVLLEECRVPASNRLGGENGCDFQLLLNSSKVGLSAMALGVARASCEYALEYAKERKAFGEAIAQRQSIAFTLAEMRTDLDAARMMVWKAAWLLDQGRDATRESCLASNFTSDMAVTVADRALQILGGYGFIREFPVELWLRNARGFAVMEGITII
ncbi:MAG: acyl-CoA dehydrogenase family protein [Acidobacteria bacterium]|nr:acyl-CoA dehydrogenase family protein [Acidobacteriota bacterium]